MAFRFHFLADCQLGCYASFSGFDEEKVARYAELGMKVPLLPKVEGFAWDAARYREAVQATNRMRPAFVASGGDMVDDLADPGQLEELKRITAELDPDIPIRWVPGNHDVAFDALAPTPASLAVYRSHFGDDVYTFHHEGAVFVVLDTTVLAAPHAVPADFEAQMAFLEEALAEARGQPGPVIVLGHHPYFLESPDEPDSYWTVPQPVRGRALDLFHRHGVRTVLSGHLHRNVRARDGDLEMVVSGPVGFPLGDDPSGFLVVEVGEGRVAHRYQPLQESGRQA